MSKNILIVEDETIVAMEIESYLLSLNYNVVSICSTADDAYTNVQNHKVDLILMDIFLDHSNGIEASRRIKLLQPQIPIIFLSAYMDEETITQAISINPEAYLMKPFNRKELEVAIRIGFKHHKSSSLKEVPKGNIILNNEFSFDSDSLQLFYMGEVISLTKKERTLLMLFLKNTNHLLTIEQMEYEIWPEQPSNDSRRRSLISRLRSKLKHKFIETYSSEGYLFSI